MVDAVVATWPPRPARSVGRRRDVYTGALASTLLRITIASADDRSKEDTWLMTGFPLGDLDR
ncbi:MAG TPA: hypothetical protein VMT03_02045 [Polyangia bacterium]|nr:hypothetical protein [Polyangia bacterium]